MRRIFVSSMVILIAMASFLVASDQYTLVEAPGSVTREMIQQEGIRLMYSYISNIRNDFFPKFPIYTYSHDPNTLQLRLVPIEYIQEGLRGHLAQFMRTIEFFSRFGNPAVENNARFESYTYDIISMVHANRTTGQIISKTVSREPWKDSVIVQDFQDLKYYPLNEMLQILENEEWVDSIILMVTANITTRAIDLVGLVYDASEEYAFLVVKLNIFQ